VVHAAIAADPDIVPTDEAFWKDARVIIPHGCARTGNAVI
jgi:hypothetical protein